MAEEAPGAPASNRELEAKLDVPEGFRMPPLDAALDGLSARPLPGAELDAVYYDTPDLRLARSGLTLRHRIGDGVGWTLKLPDEGPGAAAPLSRRELTMAGSPDEIPPALAELATAYVRTAGLAPVARLRTRRSGVEVVDGRGRRVGEIVEDDVEVEGAKGRPGRFREVEVEIDAAAPGEVMTRLLALLREAGAKEGDGLPKLVRALGAAARRPPELVVPRLRKRSSAADVLRAAMAGSTLRILGHDAGVRLGDDPEDVHQARVGARRLRSDLRTFRSLLEPGWREGLEGELRWLGAELGAVRDADVLGERLRRQGTALAERDGRGLAAILRRLEWERDEARGRLLEAMRSERYVSLLDRLVAAARDPRTLPAADRPAAEALPKLVGRPWRRLVREVRALDAEPSDEALHRVRIRAKRARYAAEAAVPAAGRRAHRLGRALAGLQDVLGEHQDAVVAEGWLRAHSRASPLVAGQLIAMQRLEGAAERAAWPKAWKRARRRRPTKWPT